MNTSIKTILAVAAMGAAAIAANAQTSTSVGQPATPKVVTVDLGRALAGYYRTAEESTKLQTFEQNANKEFENMVTEGRAMGQKFQDAQATLQSPIATDIAKQQAQADAQRLAQDLQAKQDQLNDYRQKAMQQLQQGAMQSRQQLLVEIANKANEVGKAKNANMIIERNAFVYADSGMDITDEVLAQLNKGHPMPAPAATGTAAPSAAATPTVGYPAAK